MRLLYLPPTATLSSKTDTWFTRDSLPGILKYSKAEKLLRDRATFL